MSRTKQIRARRDARIRANIKAHLGPDFQPMPDSNRVFIALNRIKDCREQAAIWGQAVLAGDTTPGALQVHREVHIQGAQVHGEVHREDTPATVETTRLEKLRYAVGALTNLETVHQFAIESHDLDTLRAYLGLLEALEPMVGMGYAVLVKERLKQVREAIRELEDDG